MIASEFEALKREISAYLGKAELKEISFIEKILNLLSQRLDRLSIPFERIVTDAQKRVVKFSAKSLSDYLSLESSIFEKDLQAFEKLIGRTQNGTSLSRFFLKMKPDLRERAKRALLESFNQGDGARVIASKLNQVTDYGYSRSLHIARSETVNAYRSATRDFYESADIQKYRWRAVLDVRTCVICWRLDGKVFMTDKKVSPHVSCRCVILPVLRSDKKFTNGPVKFEKLEQGYQQQILGKKRFELFQNGAKLKDFVGFSESAEYGRAYHIKTIDSL